VNRFRSLFFFLLTLASFLSTAFNAHASEPTVVGSVGIRIAQIPAAVAEHPFAGAYIVSRVKPGIALIQRLEVFNTSTQEIKVSVYPGAATFVKNEFLVGDGRAGNNLTHWTKLLPDVLVLKPGETKWFNMTILPPLDALSDQEFGVIWAEVQGAPNAAGITSVSRVGIRMYVPVGNAPDILIAATSMTSSTNEIIVKKSLVSQYIIEVVLLFVILSLLFLCLFLLFWRRGKSDRKFRKENEKRLEAQWKQERDRRRQIWKNRRESEQNQRYNDEYDEER
jgi:hypothetical protein